MVAKGKNYKDRFMKYIHTSSPHQQHTTTNTTQHHTSTSPPYTHTYNRDHQNSLSLPPPSVLGYAWRGSSTSSDVNQQESANEDEHPHDDDINYIPIQHTNVNHHENMNISQNMNVNAETHQTHTPVNDTIPTTTTMNIPNNTIHTNHPPDNSNHGAHNSISHMIEYPNPLHIRTDSTTSDGSDFLLTTPPTYHINISDNVPPNKNNSHRTDNNNKQNHGTAATGDTQPTASLSPHHPTPSPHSLPHHSSNPPTPSPQHRTHPSSYHTPPAYASPINRQTTHHRKNSSYHHIHRTSLHSPSNRKKTRKRQNSTSAVADGTSYQHTLSSNTSIPSPLPTATHTNTSSSKDKDSTNNSHPRTTTTTTKSIIHDIHHHMEVDESTVVKTAKPFHRITASLSGLSLDEIIHQKRKISIHTPKSQKSPVSIAEDEHDDTTHASKHTATTSNPNYPYPITKKQLDTSAPLPTTTNEKLRTLSSVVEHTAPTTPTSRSRSGSSAAVKKPSAPSSSPSSHDLTPHEIILIFCCLTTCLGLAALDSTIVTVALKAITTEFNEFTLFSWIISAYMLTSSSCTPLYGKGSDIFGRHHTMQFALFLFAIASLIGSLSTNIYMLIAARALQGVGGAGLSSLTSVIIGDILTPREQGKYIPILSGAYAVFSVSGPIIGGIFVDTIGWRWIFWINLPICFLSSVIIFMYLRHITIRNRRVHSIHDIDWLGSITILLSTGGILFAIISGGTQWSWDSIPIIVSFSGSGAFLLFFLYTQYHVGMKALIPLSMFRIRNFSLATLIMFLSGTVTFGVSAYFPSYFQIVQHNNALISGVRVLPLVGCTVVATTLAGQIITRTGHYRSLPLIGTPLQIAGCVLLIFILSTDVEYWILACILSMIGLGVGLTSPVMNVLIQSSIPIEDMAAGVTTGLFSRQLGGAMGVAVCSSILMNLYNQHITTLYAERSLGDVPVNAQNLNDQQISALGDAQGTVFRESYVYGLKYMYIAISGFAALSGIAALFVKNIPIRSREINKYHKRQSTLSHSKNSATHMMSSQMKHERSITQLSVSKRYQDKEREKVIIMSDPSASGSGADINQMHGRSRSTVVEQVDPNTLHNITSEEVGDTDTHIQVDAEYSLSEPILCVDDISSITLDIHISDNGSVTCTQSTGTGTESELLPRSQSNTTNLSFSIPLPLRRTATSTTTSTVATATTTIQTRTISTQTPPLPQMQLHQLMIHSQAPGQAQDYTRYMYDHECHSQATNDEMIRPLHVDNMIGNNNTNSLISKSRPTSPYASNNHTAYASHFAAFNSSDTYTTTGSNNTSAAPLSPMQPIRHYLPVNAITPSSSSSSSTNGTSAAGAGASNRPPIHFTDTLHSASHRKKEQIIASLSPLTTSGVNSQKHHTLVSPSFPLTAATQLVTPALTSPIAPSRVVVLSKAHSQDLAHNVDDKENTNSNSGHPRVLERQSTLTLTGTNNTRRASIPLSPMGSARARSSDVHSTSGRMNSPTHHIGNMFDLALDESFQPLRTPLSHADIHPHTGTGLSISTSPRSFVTNIQVSPPSPITPKNFS